MASHSESTGDGDTGTGAARPRVLILGGGFGGVGAARELKDADVDVMLVDRHDYHTFQPLLYQVATDLLETSACGHPLRDLFHDQPNALVHEATVAGIDLDNCEVRFEDMGPRGRQPLRRRHQHLPEHRRGEPGPHGDGQRPARR